MNYRLNVCTKNSLNRSICIAINSLGIQLCIPRCSSMELAMGFIYGRFCSLTGIKECQDFCTQPVFGQQTFLCILVLNVVVKDREPSRKRL